MNGMMPFAPGLAALAIAASVTVCRGEEPSLRYALTPGDRLVYQRVAVVASIDTGAVEQQITDQIQIWPLEQRGDEWLLLVDLRHIADGQVEPVRGALTLIDERGRRRTTPPMLTRVADMEAAFDLLPGLPLPVDRADEWTTPPDAYGRRWQCRREGPDAEQHGAVRVSFTLQDPTGVAGFLGEQRSGRYWFDAAAGVVTRIESELRHRTAGVVVQAKCKLVDRRRESGRWLIQRTDEAKQFLRALDNEAGLLADVLNNPGEIDSILRRLERVWSGVAADAADSPIRAIAAANQRRLDASAGMLRQAAARSAGWMNKPSYDWSLLTPNGEKLRSADLRDRPLVECYWSADSLWGLRSLEMMRRFVAKVGGGEVAAVRVVCLNMDRDVALAKRAIGACGDGLTHVLAESLSANEPELDFPTVRLVDRQGRVRHVVVGWRPDLYEALAPAIGKLSQP